MSVKVSLFPLHISQYVVDFTKEPWSVLNYHNLGPFKIEEPKKFCPLYPDGLFPGATSVSIDKQCTLIKRFSNYLEFSTVTEDETKLKDGKHYLTTKYFRNRERGWSSDYPLKKEGKVIGYCLNGCVYHKDNKIDVYEPIFQLAYYGLVHFRPEFQQLLYYLRAGVELELFGLDPIFLEQIKKVLLEKSKNVKS